MVKKKKVESKKVLIEIPCEHCNNTGKHFGSVHNCTFCHGTKKLLVEK